MRFSTNVIIQGLCLALAVHKASAGFLDPGRDCGGEDCRRLENHEDLFDHMIPCSTTLYQVSLVAYTGPHFELVAKPAIEEGEDECPHLQFVSSSDQGKLILPVLEEQQVDEEDTFALGFADLGKIMIAFESAEEIAEEDYDLETNNCIHFAASMWRMLEFKETKDLSNFLVNNIVGETDALEALVERFAEEGHPARKALETGSTKAYLEDVVTSQLYIVD